MEIKDINDITESTSLLSSKISEIKNMSDNYDLAYQNQFKYNSQETGIRNMNTTSHLKIYDSGNIELFSSNNSGIMINNSQKTVNIYGQGINTCTPVVMLHTKPGGLIWNNHQFNSRFYQLSDIINVNKDPSIIDDLYVVCNVRYWDLGDEDTPPHWARKQVQLKPFFKVLKDEEYSKLLTELGIPT